MNDKGHNKGHKGQMSDREVMKLALDALLIWEEMHPKTTASAIRSPAIQALQEALEQPAQIPSGAVEVIRKAVVEARKEMWATQKQQKCEWVGLTDEERDYLWSITPPEYEDQFAFVLAVESKLKEKNTKKE